MSHQTNSAEATQRLGLEFGQELQGGEVILLVGEIGSGKTTFTQGIGQALGVPDHIKSPTFVLVHEHEVHKHKTVKHLIHLDGYRLGKTPLSELGVDQHCGRADTIIVIEWPEQVEFDLENCQATHRIEFEHLEGDQRQITLQPL